MSEELKPCPFCGPRMVSAEVWRQYDTKKWVVTCGGCGASSGLCHEPSHAIAAWNTRPAPAVQVQEGWALVNRDDLDYMLGAVQRVAEAAYHRAGLVCCRVGGPECCGSPEPEWTPEDQEIMEALSPVVTGMSAMLAATPAPATVATEAGTIDVDLELWNSIKKAAAESDWIPPEYFMGDWVSDVCAFLRSRPVATEAVAQGSGVDVEKVMALVEQYGQEKWNQGDNQYRRGCHSSADYYSEEAGRIRDRIRALLASPAPAGTVGDGLRAKVIKQANRVRATCFSSIDGFDRDEWMALESLVIAAKKEGE